MADVFTWPTVGGEFKWAVNWFDVIARGNPAPGLVILEEDGTSASYSFATLVRRSDQVANWLLSRGSSRATESC